jgi:hypothetical protein
MLIAKIVLIYLLITILLMWVDALVSFAVKRKYEIIGSFFTNVFFPVTVPTIIFRVSVATKNNRDWD